MKCPRCQTDVSDTSRFCPNCGMSVARTEGDSLDTLITTYHLVPGVAVAGRYRIVKIVGRGGMGIVYHALDTELKIDVALKVLPPELSQDERAIEDLKNEARAAIKLTHPNIIRIHTFQTHEGLNFLVMEYVNGPNLSRVLGKEKAFSIQRTLSIAKQVCMGLAYAHKHSVVHRDIKPQNLMLDEDGTIKIADFGIARVISDTMSRVSQRPTTGTLVYMSPEQLQGMRVDHRSDIYSLGCCLYEFLSGKPPFWTGDIYHQHLEKEPQRIPGVPDTINTMLSICLAKAPRMRYQGAEDLLSAIERIEKGEKEPGPAAREHERKEEEEAPKVHLEQKVRKPSRKHTRIPWKTLFALMVIVLFAGIAFWFGSIKEPSQETQPVPISGRLFVEADPEDAAVRFLNIEQKYTKGMSLEEGRYHVEVSKAGYGTKRDWVTVNAGEDANLDMQLQPLPGRLFVETDPKDAAIKILDIDSAYTQGMSLEKGRYQVEVSHQGYGTERSWVTIEPGQEARLKIQLKKLLGRLFVETEPLDATVRILNITPRYTPGMELEQGDYHVEVSKEGYSTKKQWVTVNAGEEERVSFRLEAQKTAAPPSTIVAFSINYKMVYVPPGTFMMGSPGSEKDRSSDETQHRVTLTQGYYMGVTEITQGQWRAIMGSNPSYFKNCGDDCPVEQVSWEDCQEFIRRLNQLEGTNKYRLPTEAEWEYACRAGSSTAFANGDITETGCGHEPNLDRMGWYCGNANSKTHAVAQKRPNAWGLYDMHGNVWEWCQDNCEWKNGVVTDTYRDGIVDPVCRAGSYRVYRGGSWNLDARGCRSAYRLNDAPGYRYSGLGFRLARTP